ncbi:hypothetical protein BOTBODRAFT_395333 [Botryobasidium botryosum FD-172 SS1]|uniref:Uncharacterized protein n=1 Tax=Botryobasidium botryosum (strain FD-172 SS1) TaxID=930990 RepID=A0A067MC21_BOTB1|nr:hypothetical protein BOTBODRAFT_395333 [Botryobasidium botryosum FD-172 SS1]
MPQDGSHRNEVVLIRAIHNKVESMLYIWLYINKGVYAWLDLRRNAGRLGLLFKSAHNPSARAKILKGDTPTRWSSTRDMVDRAHSLCELI